MEEGDTLLLVKGVPRLKKDIDALKHLTEEKIPSRQHLRATRQAVDYLTGYFQWNGVWICHVVSK